MPSYARCGVVEFAFARRKNSISLYGLKQDALEPLCHAFTGANIGKACIQYTKPKKVNRAAVARLMQ